MESVFKICKLPKRNAIQVVGLEKENDSYLKPGDVTISKRQFLYTETATINVIKSIKYGIEGQAKAKVVEHTEDSVLDSCDFDLEFDGMYQVSHIILPTMEWLLRVKQSSPSSLDLYSVICIYDELSKDIYLYDRTKDILDVITPDQLLLLPFEVTNAITPAPSIIRADKNTFVMDDLISCHVFYCNRILQSKLTRCGNKNPEYLNDKYIRDVLWCAINSIKYHLSFNNIYEAQRILEAVVNCTEICKLNSQSIKVSDCGCSR